MKLSFLFLKKEKTIVSLWENGVYDKIYLVAAFLITTLVLCSRRYRRQAIQGISSPHAEQLFCYSTIAKPTSILLLCVIICLCSLGISIDLINC